MSSTQIKGLIIEIGGNTTKLGAALKGLDGDAKKSAAELKEINRLLKMDPGNTELLAQKQEVLAGAIQTATQRLDTLRQAEASARTQFEKGEIGAEQLRALQRETVSAEQHLNRLTQQYNDLERAAHDAGKEVKESGTGSQQAADDAEDLSKQLQQLEKDYDSAKNAAKDSGKELALGVAAAAAAVGAAVGSAASYEEAMAAIQARTGASAEEMEDLQTAVDRIYRAGYGEDLDDVASTMASISQTMGDLDTTALQELGQDAIALRDSFGFDVPEQLRAAQQLMKNFGLDAAQAYDLMAAGAQKGLDRNGDMLDVLNEYSGHYAQLGYSAEGFLSSLLAGTAQGAYSVDKLGDSMKEFGIRTKDTAASTTEAYELLGLDADQMRAMFAQGGAAAAEAKNQVLKALADTEDAVIRNQAGVGLFGTTWEDLGESAVLAMASAQESLEGVEGTMQSIIDINYTTTAAQWEALGRTTQQELIRPLGEKLLPTAERLLNFVLGHTDQLIPLVKTLGTVTAAVFLTNKASSFIGSVKTLTSAYKSLTASSSAAAAASGKVASAGLKVAAVAGMLYLLFGRTIKETEKASEAYLQLVEDNLSLVEAYRNSAQAASACGKAQAEAVRNIDETYRPYEDLIAELDLLADASGRVQEKDRERAEYILSELQSVTGTEIELVDGVILKYDELTEALQNSLTAKKAAGALETLSSGYGDAKAALDGDKDTVGSAANYEYLNYRYREIQRILADTTMSYDEKDAALKTLGTSYIGWYEQGDNTALWQQLQSSAAAYESNRNAVREYEALENAYDSGDYGAMTSAMDDLADDRYAAGNYSFSTLFAVQQELLQKYFDMLSWSKTEGSAISEEDLAAAWAEVEYATTQARSQWLAEGKPRVDNYWDSADPTASNERTGGYYSSDMDRNAQAVFALNGKDPAAMQPDSPQTADPAEQFNQVEQAFSELNGMVEGLNDADAEAQSTAQAGNETLNKILSAVEGLELTLILDDGTLVGKTSGKTDRALGSLAADTERGTLKP